MRVTTSREGKQTTLALSGRLDTLSARQLEGDLQKVYRQGFDKLVLDLAELEYISSTGLRVILTVQKQCKSRGAVLAVKNAGAAVAEAFEITGFSGFLTFG